MKTRNEILAAELACNKIDCIGFVDPEEWEEYVDEVRGRITVHSCCNPEDIPVYSSKAGDAYKLLLKELLDLRDYMQDNIHILEVAVAYNTLDSLIHKQGER